MFIPGSPNPTTGRLYFVPSFRCIRLDMSPQEALKMIISGGNYVPPELGEATATALRFYRVEGARALPARAHRGGAGPFEGPELDRVEGARALPARAHRGGRGTR